MGRPGKKGAKKSIEALRGNFDDGECEDCILTDKDVKKFFK